MDETLILDDYFAQQRLAGPNPMALMRVRTTSGEHRAAIFTILAGERAVTLRPSL